LPEEDWHGGLLVERREFSTGLAVLRDAFNTCRQTGWRWSYPEFNGTLASALAGVGRLDEALEAINEAIASAGRREDGQRWYVPELVRIKGEVLLRQDPESISAAAQACYDQAGEIAREQDAFGLGIADCAQPCSLAAETGPQ
jgi:hypothetical protein